MKKDPLYRCQTTTRLDFPKADFSEPTLSTQRRQSISLK